MPPASLDIHMLSTQKGYTEPWHIIHINEYVYDPCVHYMHAVCLYMCGVDRHTH